ncbi:MAG: hypothetical protein AAGA08_19085 [Pseudomonadota bacterium]
MTDTELEQLVSDLRQVAKKTLTAGDLTYGVFSGDRTHLSQSIITLVNRHDDNQPIAFNALAQMDVDLDGRTEPILHLGLVLIDPDTRSQGLSWILYGLTCVLILFRNGLRPLWLSNVTQVPAVVGLVSTGFARVYPAPQQPDGGRRSLQHLLLARRIVEHHRSVFGVGPEAAFDEDRFVIENAYTGGSDHLKKTFADAPKHRDEVYNEFCERQLDYDRGDDVLQLGQIDFATALSYLTREVPSRSAFSFLILAASAVIQRLALPVLHWADTDRPYGILRKRSKTP